MDKQSSKMKSPKRQPLAEKQPRTRPAAPTPTKAVDLLTGSSPGIPHHKSLNPEYNLSLQESENTRPTTAENKRVSAINDDLHNKRDSQISNTSTGSRGKRKTHVGPWQLGKTLGKGATGRVRLAKHSVTGQTAAIKIVSKKSAAKLQSASMVKMDEDDTLAANLGGIRTMPFGIEREVVIMKLIEHPNIVNLYDIWENRGELYLVLEYVEGGELFDYVSSNGALPEVEAVRLFRQILAGLSYCHRFNICHRDLKPENILLDAHRNVKLADFGMAALQPTNKWLNTSCGSPHYAAPEVAKGASYRGEVADIWSIGIILYAMLNGFLPFDGGDVITTLFLVKKGEYYLPPTLSDDAADLIQRILQKHPGNRITMPEIWKHPLLQKYESLHASVAAPGKLVGPALPLSTTDCGHRVKRAELDFETIRNLQTLWHGEKQEEIIKRLTSEGPNYEKLFYRALVRFREEQLENYPGDPLQYSTSDYHHAPKFAPKPLRQSGTGHDRQLSQFSILSDEDCKRDSYYKNPAVAVSKNTQSSYDPYRASRTPIVASTADGTTVTVRHAAANRMRSGSQAESLRHQESTRLHNGLPPIPALNSADLEILVAKKRQSYSTVTSRSSLVSSHRGNIRKSVSYKRKVSFQHSRQRSSSTAPRSRLNGHDRLASQEIDDLDRPVTQSSNQGFFDNHSTPSLPSPTCVAQPRNATSELNLKKPRVASQFWKEDTRKVSAELGKICEEAFNRSSVSSGSGLSHYPLRDSPATTVSASDGRISDAVKNRPLPLTPALHDLVERRQKIIEAWGDADPIALSDVITTLDRRIEEEFKKSNIDYRSASDPTHGLRMRKAKLLLSAQGNETPNWRNEPTRAASDSVDKRNTTIRLVSPDPSSPVRIEPLAIRKNKIMPTNPVGGLPTESFTSLPEREGHFYHQTRLDTIEEDPKSPKLVPTNTVGVGRKWSWLARKGTGSQEDLPPTPSKKESLQIDSQETTTTDATSSRPRKDIEDETDETIARKRKWFQKIFGKSGKKEGTNAHTSHEVINEDHYDTESMASNIDITRVKTSRTRRSHHPATSVDAAAAAAAVKPIEINQNWFAKIFHLKPASRLIVMQVSKVRARKEIVKTLREWKRFGLRDIAVERSSGSDMVRGRVDAANYLHIKPVSFYAHLYTILEHGRRANLSVIKFTQEKGAASSFYRVVDTLESVLKENGILVADTERKKDILKGIKEAGL